MVVTTSLIAEINRAKWIWSKTYAEYAPHWYILKHQYPGLFWRLSRVIFSDGTDREFRNTGRVYRYLEINGWQFWQIGNVINRARASDR